MEPPRGFRGVAGDHLLAGRLPSIREDEEKFLASHDNPVCPVVEHDSPMGPNGEATHVELRYGD